MPCARICKRTSSSGRIAAEGLSCRLRLPLRPVTASTAPLLGRWPSSSLCGCEAPRRCGLVSRNAPLLRSRSPGMPGLTPPLAQAANSQDRHVATGSAVRILRWGYEADRRTSENAPGGTCQIHHCARNTVAASGRLPHNGVPGNARGDSPAAVLPSPRRRPPSVRSASSQPSGSSIARRR